MTLNDRINKDLGELYCGLEISSAKAIEHVFPKSPLSTKGLPNHFSGNREAKTVFVMLNPGIEAKKANALCGSLTASYDRSSKTTFVDSYRFDKENVVVKKPDTFDIKQAAFLKPWQNSGVNLGCFDPKNKNTYLAACTNVLNQKLQLELIPYCSNSFGNIGSSNVRLILPYLETIIDEISSVERKYVIFGSGKFEQLFKEYEKNSSAKIIWGNEQKSETTIFGSKIPGKCRMIRLNSIKAIIAHTFPYRYYLPYSRMENYGSFCYDVFKNSII